MPPAGTGAVARIAVLDDHDVAELGPAAEEPSVEDDTAADPGAQREHHQAPDVDPGAQAELGVCGSVRVVLDPDGEPETVLHLRPKVEVLNREVHGAEDD